MKPTRVMFALPNLQGGGAERVFVHLMRHIDRRRFEPVLAVGRFQGAYSDDVPDDIEVIELGAERARSATFALLKAAWKLRPQVLFATLGFSASAALLRPVLPSDTRVVVRIGNTLSAYLADVRQDDSVLAAIYHMANRLTYAGAHTVVVQSDYMKRDVEKILSVSGDKLTRIYNPVDVTAIHRQARAGIEDAYEGGGPQLVCVGRLSFQKDHRLLLNAVDELRDRHPNIQLTVLGEGDQRRELEEQVHDLNLDDHVRFLGFVDNPYPFVAQADLFVLPSRYEGFANVILESVGLGTPVVAMDCPGGNAEIIREGFNGWLCRRRNPKALAVSIDQALARLDDLDSEAMIDELRERFDIAKIVGAYSEVLSGSQV